MKLKPDPMGETRNPFQVFLLCLAIFTSLTMLSTNVPPAAGSVEYYLNEWQEMLWAWLLIIGSVFALVGMYWQGDARNGLVLKRFGLTTLCVPVFIYGFVLITNFGFETFAIVMILWGFAVASGIQAYRVNRHIRGLIDRTEHERTE